MSKPQLKIEPRVSHLAAVQPGAESASAKTASTALLVVAFAAVYLIWGSTYLAIKYAIGTLPPFLMAGSRFLIAGSMLFTWARIRGARPGGQKPFQAWRRAFVIGALLLLGGNGGVTWAERYLSSGLAALLVASEPLWVVMWNWISGGSRPNAKASLGLITGLAGVGLLVSGGFGASQASTTMSLLGAGAVIIATMSWAGGSVYSIHRPVQASAPLASGMQMLSGGACLLLLGLFTGEFSRLDLKQASWLSLGALLYLIVFGSIVAFTAYSYLLRNVSPARAATYAYVNPVVAVLLGWALANEPVTPRMVIAAAVIVASVVLITTYGKERGKEKGAEVSVRGPDPSPDTDPCPTHPCA